MLENIPSPAPLRVLALEDLLGMELPRLGKVLDPWLPERGLALLHGPRGIGKTHLALAIGHAVATGGRLLRWRAPCARRVGRAVLFIHHSARSGAQRGTSRREDVMDTVLALRPPAEAHVTAGARFEVHVEKNRGFWAEATVPFGALLRDGAWHMEALSDPHTPLVVALTEEGWSIRQIAERLELSKSTVHRMQYAARLRGLLAGHFYGGLVDDRPFPGVAVPAAPDPGSRIRGQDDDDGERGC